MLGVVLAVLLGGLGLGSGLGVAYGQAGGEDGFGFSSFEATDDDAEPVTVSVVSSRLSVPAGGEVVIAVVLDHSGDWHTWPSEEQNVLPENIAEFAIHTSIEIGAVEGVRFGRTQWPTPKTAAVANPEGYPPTVEVPLFAGKAVAFVPVRLDEGLRAGTKLTLPVRVSYQACDDSICRMPESLTFEVVLTVADAGSVGASAIGDDADAALFAGFDSAGFATVGDGSTQVRPEESDGAVGAETADVVPIAGPRFFGLQLPDPRGPVGLIVLLFVSAVGGFILNLTPCVLPVIPIKVMTRTSHAGSPSRALVLGLWMAFGVFAFWFALGLPVAFLSSVTDPSAMFRHWPVTMGIGVVIAAMGLGIMGLFSINLPQGVYGLNPKADSPGGSFLFGLMTALLGLPCFGFVVGGLLPGTAAFGPQVIMAIFAGLGLGMAVPYVVLSANPKWIEKLPRTGPASDLVKQVMGLLLFAAAAFFITVSVKTLLKGRPYLEESIQWWAVALFVLAAGVLLVVRTFSITKKPARRAVFSAIGLGLVASFVGVAVSLTGAARERYEDRQRALELAMQAGAGGGAFVPGVWLSYSPAAMSAARDAGYVVFLDFTADWCINCKALKRTVLDGETVRERFGRGDVVIFSVDIDYPDGKALFDSLGRAGIPAWAVYTPGVETPEFVETFTPGEVVRQLDRASSNAQRSDAGMGGGGGVVGGSFVPGVWLPYSPASMTAARDAGYVVLTEFTANWCIHYKMPRLYVLDVEPVSERFARGDVVMFEADIDYPDGKALFDSLGRVGIPAWAVYTPGVESPEFLETLTSGELIRVLDKASSNAQRSDLGAAVEDAFDADRKRADEIASAR